MADSVPPIPYKQPAIDQRTGHFTEPWNKWFRQMFNRVGGSVALSNTELASLPALELSGVQTDITTLQNLTTSLSNRITQLEKELDQGPVL